ncbi:MAG: hypothetical protein EA397_08570 [Deltaproteobacteria bacterium]|nr:MAG: hypothetical protein EA397_08570 [Deltaproteobacteria bacterium]
MSRALANTVLVSALAAPLVFAACNEDEIETDAGVTASLSLTPSVAGQGQTLNVRMSSVNSRFAFGDTELDLGAGINVQSVTVEDGFSAVALVSVDPDAELGLRDAVIEIEGVRNNLTDAFEVRADSILNIEPNNGKMGEVLDVAIVGSGTDWEDGYSWLDLGRGIRVRDFQVLSPTLATANLIIRADARPGPRDVVVETGPNFVTLHEGFTVDRSMISCDFQPEVGYQGETKDFTITCLDTDWGPDTRIEFWDSTGLNRDIAVTTMTALDGENMFGRIRLSNAAFVGMRDVYITNGDEAVLLPDAFEVLDAPPRLDNVAVSLLFDIQRQIDNSSGELIEQVRGQAAFVVPLDPPCGAASPPGDGPMPYDINGVFPIPPPPDPVDCPSPQTVPAGDFVYFDSDENSVPLARTINNTTGQVVYVGQNLTLDDYRFNKLYDLRTEGEPDGIPELVLERVQPTVPADYYLLTPNLYGSYAQSRLDDFNYTWTPAETYPDAIFITQISATLAVNGEPGFAGSIPWDDGDHTYTPAELTQLEPGPVTFLLVSVIEGPFFGLPFSTIQTNQSSSQLLTFGRMVLE